jgi:hypothetical protein
MLVKDLIFMENERKKNHPLLNGKAYGAKRWMPDDPRLPFRYRPVDYQPGPKGRTPQSCQFKRKPATVQRDQMALALRLDFGYRWKQIAEILGCSSAQVAYESARRGYRDRLVHAHRNEKPSLALVSAFPRRPPPRLHPEDFFASTKRKGVRGCGCFLVRGQRIAYVNNRQWCLPCAFIVARITWAMLEDDPTLITRMDVRPRIRGHVVKPAW